jgi:uncharacterized protein (TIGR02117 family)
MGLRPETPAPAAAKTGRHWAFRWLRRLAAGGVFFLLAALLALLVGLIPANRDFRQAEGGIDIYVLSSGVHTDIIVPTVTDRRDWNEMLPVTDFAAVDQPASYLQFGWGDRAFYLETPTWADVKASTVVRAMFWSSATVMHVEHVGEPMESDTCRRLSLSQAQYEQLATQLADGFARSESGGVRRIPGASYGLRDAFYEATDSYHLLSTCNCWTGRMLRGAGVRCGIWTPTTWSVMWTLPED